MVLSTVLVGWLESTKALMGSFLPLHPAWWPEPFSEKGFNWPHTHCAVKDDHELLVFLPQC